MKSDSGEASGSPLISIYIPTRGRVDLLTRALRSALNQDYQNLEVVVAVDGPDEETQRLLGAWAEREPRLRYIVLPVPGGACRARNAALGQARGDYVTGLDDDDELLPEHISHLLREMLDRDVAFVCTTAVYRRSTGEQIRHRFSGPVTFESLCWQNVIGNQVFTTRRALQDIGGFDPTFPAWQDYDTWLRLAQHVGPGWKVDARTYIQHLDHESERVSHPDRIRAASRLFLSKHGAGMTADQRASVELLALATTHHRLSEEQLLRFFRSGLRKRALVAYLSGRFPMLRGFARRFLPAV